jgi:hypothetical protein
VLDDAAAAELQAANTNGAAGEVSDAAVETRPGSASRGDAPNAGSTGRAPSPPTKKTTPRGSRAQTPRGKDGRDKGAAADVLLSNEAIMQQLGVQVR